MGHAWNKEYRETMSHLMGVSLLLHDIKQLLYPALTTLSSFFCQSYKGIGNLELWRGLVKNSLLPLGLVVESTVELRSCKFAKG